MTEDARTCEEYCSADAASCSSRSSEGSTPGMMFPGENADCSVSSKKFSGMRFRVILPTLTNGATFSGHTLVASSGLKENLSTSSGFSICTNNSQLGSLPLPTVA